MDMDILAISVFSLVVDGCPVDNTVIFTYAIQNCFIIFAIDTNVSVCLLYHNIWYVLCSNRLLSFKLYMYYGNYFVSSSLLFLYHIMMISSLSSNHILRVFPLRSLLHQCRNINNSFYHYYLGVSDLESLIFALLVFYITVIITVLILWCMTHAHYIYSSQPICMLHAYYDCMTDRLWRSNLRTKLTLAGTDHTRSSYTISLQPMDHMRPISTEYVCCVFYISLVLPLIILCQMPAVIDDDNLPNDSPVDPVDHLYLLCDFNTNNNSNDSNLLLLSISPLIPLMRMKSRS